MQLTLFNKNNLTIKPLSERKHDLDILTIRPLQGRVDSGLGRQLKPIALRLARAREAGVSAILMMGGHVIRAGVQRYLIDLMERRYICCIATNGAGMIHDFEFALIGATTENVARYMTEGQFGLWRETGRLNDYINAGYRKGLGMGQAVGQAILEGDFPFKDTSILAAACRLQIPVTIHVGIGYDIIHEHPNCDGAAAGETSYRDFLCLAAVVENLEGGVVMNFGSAVMAPEVFLKTLNMARNAAHSRGKSIRHFTTLVCDIQRIEGDLKKEPSKDDPAYYFRPLKTMLIRTVADGGESFYVCGKHEDTIPALWNCINEMENAPVPARDTVKGV